MRTTLLLVAFLPVTFAAGADDNLALVGEVGITCPVCAQAFQTLVCTQTNTRGGVDRDLFPRALGPQPEFYRLSTCPTCGYSGYHGDFDPSTAIPPDVVARIRGEPGLRLPEGFNAESDPGDLDASVRYELAISCYRWRQKSAESLAWLHLRASWVAREEGAVLPPDDRLARVMAFIGRWRPAMPPDGNQTDVELALAATLGERISAGEFNRYQKPYVELALALILRQHGENRQASPLLDKLATHERFEPPLREGIERMRRSIAVERQYQLDAAHHFEAALVSGQISGGNRGPACYLLGELQRRLGRDPEAAKWYRQALAAGPLPPDLERWAREQARWAGEVSSRQ